MAAREKCAFLETCLLNLYFLVISRLLALKQSSLNLPVFCGTMWKLQRIHLNQMPANSADFASVFTLLAFNLLCASRLIYTSLSSLKTSSVELSTQ